MRRQTFQTLLVAGVVLFAGCVGGLSGSPGSPITDGNQPGTDSPGATTDAGTVAFYISDEANAIGDFRHLNVTVTRVGFERSPAEGGGWVEREVDDERVDLTALQGANATLIEEYDLPNGTYTKVFVHVSDVNATLENGDQVRVKLPSGRLQLTNDFTVENGSEVDFVFDIAVHKAGNSGKYILTPVVTESGTDVPIEPTGDEERREGLNLRFVGNVSQGENASIVVTHDGEPVENATVLVNEDHVGSTAEDGRITFAVPSVEKVKVKVKKGDNQAELEVEFESEREDDEGEDDEDEGDEDEDDEDASLTATFVGNVSQGENVTLRVTRNGSAVANATVFVNDAPVGTTDADGELTFEVPTAETLTVIVQMGEEEVELEREFESDDHGRLEPMSVS